MTIVESVAGQSTKVSYTLPIWAGNEGVDNLVKRISGKFICHVPHHVPRIIDTPGVTHASAWSGANVSYPFPIGTGDVSVDTMFSAKISRHLPRIIDAGNKRT